MVFTGIYRDCFTGKLVKLFYRFTCKFSVKAQPYILRSFHKLNKSGKTKSGKTKFESSLAWSSRCPSTQFYYISAIPPLLKLKAMS